MNSPSGSSTTSSSPTPTFDFTTELEKFIKQAERTAFGPSTQAIVDEAVSRDIPWIRLNKASLVQLGPGRAREADPGHHDVRDRLDRGRRCQ